MMKGKRMNKIGLAVAGFVMLMGSFCLAQAAEEFSCHIEDKVCVLKSGLAEIRLRDKMSVIKKEIGRNKENNSELIKRLRKLETGIAGIKGETAGQSFGVLDKKISGIEQEIKRLGLLDKKYIIWYKNPMVQLKPTDLPSSNEEITELRLNAYINEYESTAFVLSNPTDKSIPVRVILSDLEGNSGSKISRNQIEIRTTSFVKAKQLDAVIGDALPLINQAKEVILVPKESTQVWLTVNTKDFKAGDYRGSITIKPHYGEFPIKKISLKIKIYPLKLPEKRHIGALVCNMFDHPTGHGGGKVSDIVFKRYVKDLVEHGVTAPWWNDCSRLNPKWDQKGNVIETFPKAILFEFDRFILGYKDHNPTFLLYFGNALGTRKGALARDFGFLTPTWKKVAGAWVKALVKHLRKLGVDYDGFYLLTQDEASGKSREDMVRINKWVREEVDPKIKFWWDCTIGGPRTTLEDAKEAAPYIDLWIPVSRTIENEQILEFLKSTGDQVWFYNAPYNHKSFSPLSWYRWGGWFAWEKGLSGACFFAYDRFIGDPWDDYDAGTRGPLGDANLIYDTVELDSRGRAVSRLDGPVTSRRWEAFRDGLDDYEYCYLLKETIEKARRKKIDTSSAESLLSQFTDKVYKNSNPDAIYKYRDEIAEVTVKLVQAIERR